MPLVASVPKATGMTSPVGGPVEHAGLIGGLVGGHAVVGEPEAAVTVEDQIVGGPQSLALALGDDLLDRAAAEVHALEAPARPRRRASRRAPAARR